jgi:putative membrane protein
MMGRYSYGYMYPSGWGIGFGIVGVVFQVIIWAVIIWGIVMIVRGIHHHHGMGGEPESVEILKQRYAKGEITKKEFEEMKKDIA